jgi:hypothetical protein
MGKMAFVFEAWAFDQEVFVLSEAIVLFLVPHPKALSIGVFDRYPRYREIESKSVMD